MKNTKTMSKTESLSADDLAKIIKKMIKKTLDDNAHMVKLHRAVCEEWYSLLSTTPPTPPKVHRDLSNAGKTQEMLQFAEQNLQKSELHNVGNSCKTSKKKIPQDEEFTRKLSKSAEKVECAGRRIKEDEENAWRQRAWEFYHQQKRQQQGWRRLKSFELNSWLNQLDTVLHQKYLRERRHRVQSFYCQPMYYGSEIPQALYQAYLQQCGFS